MSVSSSGTSGFDTTPSVVSYGLISGINTSQIIQAELQQFEIPIKNLQSEQSTIASNVGDYQQINSDLLAMQNASNQLASPSGWQVMSATSSNTAVATATAGPGTPAGSVQFSVLQLAAADSLVSSGTATSTTQTVTSQSSYLLSKGGGQLGFTALADGSGVALGSHTITVSQSSQAASATGTTSLGSETSGINITTGTNDTVNVTVNGTAYTLTLAASPSGGYSGSQLLSAVSSAISAAGASGVLQAGYNSAGDLILSTVDQGSSQTLNITGGDALSTLGMSTVSSTGVDAVVSVDGTSNSLSTVVPGASVTLSGPSGSSITATLAGGSSQQTVASSLLQAGTLTATNISTGNGSLADVVSNINAANAGVLASAVQTSSGAYVLQLSSTTTGTAGNLSVDRNAFSGTSLGTMNTAVAGQDAELQVGGSAGYTVSSQTNTFTGLLPGLTVNAQEVSTSPVTVNVAQDASAVASSVQSLVDDANTVLSDLQKYAGYNATTKTAGPLMGSAVLQGLTNSILSAFASTSGTSSLGTAANAGIKISNGQITFDKTAFESALAANASEVQSLFTAGGTFSPASSVYAGQVQFTYASNTTKAGTYQVQISQSAAQASDTGASLSSGSVGSAETLTISMGSSSATFTTAAGQSLTSIASGLNSAFAAQGMQLSAQVVGGGTQLQLVSADYGSATQFTVSSSNPTGTGTLGLTGGASSATFSGTNVAGTINGVAATGTGQFLSAPAGDPTLGGLSLQVTATGITSLTTLGSFTYSPGLAQVLSNISNGMSDPVNGAITTTVKGLQDQSVSLTPQIQMYQQLLDQEQKMLMAKYATMEATLGTLKNQSTTLASQLAQLSTTG
jgi:flagellar hook-associated protein 2